MSETRFRERELHLELAPMARLNMMGETAAMLAHELNQPLTATSNYLAAARAVIETSGTPVSARITEILSRATAIAMSWRYPPPIAQFCQKGEATKTHEKVVALFDEAVALLGSAKRGA